MTEFGFLTDHLTKTDETLRSLITTLLRGLEEYTKHIGWILSASYKSWCIIFNHPFWCGKYVSGFRDVGRQLVDGLWKESFALRDFVLVVSSKSVLIKLVLSHIVHL